MVTIRTHYVFYALIAYIFLSAFWWFVLLIRINNERFAYRTQWMELQRQWHAHTGLPADDALSLEKVQQDRRQQTIMIIGEGIGFFLILTILSALSLRSLRKEEQMLNRQKNFLLSVTHELKSPLAAIRVALQTLQRHAEVPPSDAAQLRIHALNEAARLESLINNLLLAARLEAPAQRPGKEVCDLSQLTSECVDTLRQTVGRDHRLEWESPGPLWVWGDKQGLRSVVSNVLENAIKYSPAGSRIAVSAEREGRRVALRISDEGPGIPEQERHLIFEKFYRIGQEETRKTQGTGLGLYIAQKLVALQGGNIQVDNNKPQGTIFTIRLPASET
ncbi:MAG: ATP-binding protein [Chitinophagales bacterium]|nr:ATP-binding protein [Chitinophagales bacterium]MDW8392703.1 ATP-binding protein [Chitinophagales bacterium]